MRLSEWRKKAPLAEAASNQVMAVVQPLLVDLGAKSDAECWVVWGEDPGTKYSILAPALGGLITIAVRPLGQEDGPRAAARLIRWSKLGVSELAVDSSGGHRIVAVQVESYVLKGVDEDADRICEFVRGLVTGIENRVPQQVVVSPTVAVAGVAQVAALAAPDAAGSGAAKRVAASEAAAPGAATVGRRSGRSAVAPVEVGVPVPISAAPSKARQPKGDGAAASQPAAKKVRVAASHKAPRAGAAVAVVPAPEPIVVPAGAAESAPAPAASASPAAPVAGDGAGHDAGPLAARTGVHHEPRPSPLPRIEPERSEWISPHPIAEPNLRQKAKPRRWTP